MNKFNKQNIELFKGITRNIYHNNNKIDILINPEIYSDTYGMTCRFLLSDMYLNDINTSFKKDNIRVIRRKSNMVRVVDNRTYRLKIFMNVIITILVLILGIIYLSIAKLYI